MDWMSQLGSLLQQYQGSNSSPTNVSADFDQFTDTAPNSVVADGLTAAFRSNATPSFGRMVSQLFAQSNGQQQAGLLNTLLTAAGPSVLNQIVNRGGGGSGIADLLRNSDGSVTPQQAQEVPPEVVHELAAQTEKHDPSVVEQISNFYAQHPTLVKTLGAAALSVAMTKIAQRQYG